MDLIGKKKMLKKTGAEFQTMLLLPCADSDRLPTQQNTTNPMDCAQLYVPQEIVINKRS
jgi:hypothetical protein